jgi:hypothetical protein
MKEVQYSEVPKRFLRKIKQFLRVHKKLINKLPEPEQIDTTKDLTPCCGDKCECDLLDDEYEVVQRRANIFF